MRIVKVWEGGSEGRRECGKEGVREGGSEGRRECEGRREGGKEGVREGGSEGRRECGKEGVREGGREGRVAVPLFMHIALVAAFFEFFSVPFIAQRLKATL